MFLNTQRVHLPALLSALLLLQLPILAQEAPKSEKKDAEKQKTAAVPKEISAQDVAESVIFIYGGILGRKNLAQIRKTSQEKGKITRYLDQGSPDVITYEKWMMRGDDSKKDKIRIDQSNAGYKFSLLYSNEKIFGIYNDSIFTPNEAATNSLKSEVFHGLEAVFRYKENSSTLALAGREKLMGVEYYLLDVTDSEGGKTRFYVSVRTFRVLMLEYDQDGAKYRRKFYDHNVAQGTLFPYRTTLFKDEKLIEENEILTVTYGQKLDETLFQQN